MLEQVRICAVSLDSQAADIAGNLQKIDHWAGQAAESGADLILFPELSLSGFIPNHPMGDHNRWLRQALATARSTAQTVPGQAAEQLTQIARQHQLLICAGMLEDAGNLMFNTQILVGPGGLLGSWRKMHIPMFEMPFYNGGSSPPVVQTPLGRIGVNICFDAFLPESTRMLAVQNVEIVLFPFAADPPPVTPASWLEWAEPTIRSRCLENGIFGIGCNYVGNVRCAGIEQTFPGGAVSISPRGQVIQRWTDGNGQPGMMTVNLIAQELTQARAEPEYLFRYRRPEIYRSLSE